MFHVFWKYGRINFLLAIVISVCNGMLLPLQLIIIQNIVDTATVSVIHESVINGLLLWVILLFLQQLAGNILRKCDAYINLKLRNSLELNWGKKLYHQCSKIKYMYYEEKETYEIIDRVTSNFKTTAISSSTTIPIIISIVVTLIGVMTYIVQSGFLTIAIILITSLPIWTFSIMAALKERNVFRECYPHLLKSKYLSSIINSREHIKESRIFGFNSYIEELWKDSLYKFQHGVFSSNLKERNITAGFVMIQYIAMTCSIFSLLIPLKKEIITIGFLVAVAQALWSFVGDLQYRIISVIQNYHLFNRFKEDYEKIFSYDVQGENNTNFSNKNNFVSVEFQDVWFRYNDKDGYILKGVNLKFDKGDTIALVGKNGCGKTTIIKLLLGLLSPTSGRILVNGYNIDDYLASGNRKDIISAIFQDYAKFNVSLRENVAISNLSNMNNENEIMRLLTSLCNADKLMKNMNNGLDSILGKNIDEGVDLSGGQWQTIAIARALFANTPILIMDEPTAALDPVAESEVYKQFNEASRDKTVVYITHRLGAAKFADKIFTLEQGQIIETGTHDELMVMEGVYASMFNKQKQWYE